MNNKVEHVPIEDNKISNEETPIYYTNQASISSNLFDLQLVFSQNTVGSSNNLISREMVKVVMSLQHAKMLYRLIGKHIEDYENNIGNLYIEPKLK